MPTSKKFFSKQLFRNESHYIATVVIIVCAYVLYMHLAFNPDWTNDVSWIKSITSVMAKIIPAIRKLRELNYPYTPYWGAFFSFFWLTVPLYWILGFTSVSFLSKVQERRLKINTTITRILLLLVIYSGGAAWSFTSPISSGVLFFNQFSKSSFISVVSWLFVAGSFYYQAQMLRVFIGKVKFLGIFEQ